MNKEIMDLEKLQKLYDELVLEADFYESQVTAFKLLGQQKYEGLTKKQITTLIEKISNAHDTVTVLLIIDLMKLFLKTEENKENE